MKREVYIYPRFERFWHWAQSLLIALLALTGFEVHGSYTLLGYRHAVRVHEWSAWALMALIVFAIFWHFTTGAWKQYIPTRRNLIEQLRYYTHGIFVGAPHPVRKTVRRKMNPLQVWVYLSLKVLFIPLMVGSGLLYMGYRFMYGGQLQGLSFVDLGSVAFLHTLGAYLLLQFVLVHVYMTTTGHTLTANIRSMITGYELLEEDTPAEETSEEGPLRQSIQEELIQR